MTDELRLAIIEEAKRIGANPHDFATVMSYETGGTFDPWKRGPTTQWGQHVGLIQMGEPQRKKYGYSPDKSVRELVKASADYLVDNGFKPGMGLLDMYSTINAGTPGRYNASDANNGGAPGTVADKVFNQMGGHKDKANALLGGQYQPSQISSPMMYPSTPGVTVNSPTPPADYSWLDDFVPVKNESPQQQYFRELYTNPDPPGFFSSLPTAFRNEWAAFNAMDTFSTSYARDPNFTGAAKEEAFKKVTEGVLFPEDMLNTLSQAGSAEEMYETAAVLREQLKREEELAAAGFSGFAATLLAAMADPIAIGAAVITEGTLAPVLAAAKAGRVARVGAAALSGATGNVAAEAAVDAFDYRKRTVSDYAIAFGAGAALAGAYKFYKTRDYTVGAQLVNSANKAVKLDPATSAGAMQVGDINTGVVGDLTNLDDTAVPQSAFSSVRADVVNWAGKHDAAARFLARALGEDAVGRDMAGNVLNTADAVSVDKAYLYHREVNNLKTSLVEPYKQWVIDNDKGWFKSNNTWLEFGDYLSQFEPGAPDSATRLSAQPEYIRKAVAELDTFYKRWDGMIHRPGDELGKELRGLPWGSRDNYRPMMANHDSIMRLLDTYGKDRIVRAISMAMQDVVENLDEKLARKFAAGYFDNLSRSGYNNVDRLNHVLVTRDRGELLDYITTDLGWDKADEDVEKLVGKIMSKNKADETGSNPSRGKHRAAINYNYVAAWDENGTAVNIPIRNLFLRNQILMAERYADQVSGYVSLARLVAKNPETGETLINGITTKAEWDNLLRQIEDRMTTNKVNPRKVTETINRLQYMYDMIVGRPRLGAEANAAWVAGVRRVTDTMFVRLMQNMGLYQLQEMAHIPAAVGFKAAFKAIPAMRLIMTAKGREKKELIPELMALSGMGDDSILNFTRHHFMEETFGETPGSKFWRGYDNFLGTAKRTVNNMSLFNMANSAAHQMTMLVIAQKFGSLAMKHADKVKLRSVTRMKDVVKTSVGPDGKIVREVTQVPEVINTREFKVDDINSFFGKKDADRMRMLGFNDKTLGEVLDNIYKYAEFTEGGRLVHMNFEKWDPSARAKFGKALFAWTGRVIQRNDVGSLAKWMTHPLAAMAFQFRSFLFGAFGKQTLHNLSNMDPRTMTVMMTQLLAGSALFALTGKLKSLGKEDPEQYMEENILKGRFTDSGIEGLFWGGLGRTGFMSVLPMFIDTAMPWIGQDMLFSNSRSSGMASDLWLGSPFKSMFDDVNASITAVSDMIKDGRTPSQPELRKIAKLLGVWLPYTILVDTAIQDFPKFTPKDN